MPADLASLNAVLKEDYKELIEQLNNDCWLYQQIEKGKQDRIDGRRAQHPIHTRRSSGIGSRQESENLPGASQQSWATVNVPLRYHFGRIQISLQAIEQAKKGVGSFVDGLDAEMQGVRKDVMRDRCRQVWGTSNGVIAQCGVTSSATTVVLAPGTTAAQMRQIFFDGGMVVDIGTVANPVAVATQRAVTAVSGNVASPTMTTSGAAVTTSALHFVFRTGNGGASSNSGLPNDGQRELTGLQTIVSATDILHTINPSTETVWASRVFAGSGLPTEALINNAITDVAEVSGEVVNALVSSRGVNQAIANLMLSTKRHVIPSVELKGGYRGIAWNTPTVNTVQEAETALVIDADCPESQIFGLHFGSLTWYNDTEAGWQWMDDDGAVLHRLNGSAGYEATLYSFAELAANRRNTHFRITGITPVSA